MKASPATGAGEGLSINHWGRITAHRAHVPGCQLLEGLEQSLMKIPAPQLQRNCRSQNHLPGHLLCVVGEFMLSPKAVVCMEDHSVLRLLANYWVATGRSRIQAWTEGLCWYSMGLQAWRHPRQTCSLVCQWDSSWTSQWVEPNHRESTKLLMQPWTAAEQRTHNGTWDICDCAPREWEHKCFHQWTSALIRWRGERGLVSLHFALCESREFYTRVLLRQKP